MAGPPAPWTFNLNDTDPVLNYQPYSDGPFTNGWQAGWSNIGVSPPDQDHNDGSGFSYHVTSFPNASVSLSFFGTGVSLIGETNCSYDVILDGSPVSSGIPPSPSGTLYSGSGLDNTVHGITLQARPTSSDQTLNFTGAQLIAPAASSPVAERIDNQNTSVITYAGSWITANAHQVPKSQNPSPYFVTNTSGSSASLQFTGRAVAVRGQSNFGWWTYSANLDGRTYNMNASSVFIVPDALLFYQDGLDENGTHSLTLTNTAADSFFFSLNSVTVYHFESSVSGTPSSSSSPNEPSNPSSTAATRRLSGGAIAGICIGAFAGFTILVSVLLWIYRGRRRAVGKHDRANIEPFVPTNRDMAESTGGTIGRASKATLVRESGTGAAEERTPHQGHTSVSMQMQVPDSAGGKRQPLPNTPVPAPESQAPSAARSPGSPDHESVQRLADAVVERLALRFGSDSHDSGTSPPSYSQH